MPTNVIPLRRMGTTCFLLSFSSITRHFHIHSFYTDVILHTVHPSLLRSTSTRVPIYIHTHHSFRYLTFSITYPYQATLSLLIFSNRCIKRQANCPGSYLRWHLTGRRPAGSSTVQLQQELSNGRCRRVNHSLSANRHRMDKPLGAYELVLHKDSLVVPVNSLEIKKEQ
jgi:hypothetical protein